MNLAKLCTCIGHVWLQSAGGPTRDRWHINQCLLSQIQEHLGHTPAHIFVPHKFDIANKKRPPRQRSDLRSVLTLLYLKLPPLEYCYMRFSSRLLAIVCKREKVSGTFTTWDFKNLFNHGTGQSWKFPLVTASQAEKGRFSTYLKFIDSLLFALSSILLRLIMGYSSLDKDKS